VALAVVALVGGHILLFLKLELLELLTKDLLAVAQISLVAVLVVVVVLVVLELTVQVQIMVVLVVLVFLPL
jgi:hypothetical protein